MYRDILHKNLKEVKVGIFRMNLNSKSRKNDIEKENKSPTMA